jgi:peroxiredoxin
MLHVGNLTNLYFMPIAAHPILAALTALTVLVVLATPLVKRTEPQIVHRMTQTNSFPLPPNLPRPNDDGAARHLVGMPLPDLDLPSTSNRTVNLSTLTSAPRIVIYTYPMTGRPGRPLPAGWDDIPGARGCTPETCGFRDHHADLARLDADVFGISTQDTEYQQEMVKRLDVPFEVLSDQHLAFVNALRLPTFQVDGMTLMKRLTMVAHGGRIEKVFYPVFPPDAHAEEVIAWLRRHPIAAA